MLEGLGLFCPDGFGSLLLVNVANRFSTQHSSENIA